MHACRKDTIYEGAMVAGELAFTGAYYTYWSAGAAISSLTVNYGHYIIPTIEFIESANPGMLPPHLTLPGVFGWYIGTEAEDAVCK